MNSTHAAVGIGGTSAVAMLTVLLTGWHGFDADHATAASWLIANGVGGIYALAAWFISWKWPNVPPLPDEANPLHFNLARPDAVNPQAPH